MTNHNQIKVGSHVRIINPQIFIRCGYPMCISETIKTIDPKIVIAAMVSTGAGTYDEISTLIKRHPHHHIHRAYKKIISGLALAKMMANSYGGSERKIYTEERPEFKDKIVIVESKRRVVTGSRWPGCGPGYYGDEAEGPTLENQKHHVILSFWTVFYGENERISGGITISGDTLEIEQSNVELWTPRPEAAEQEEEE